MARLVMRLGILAMLPAIAWGQGSVVEGSVVNSVTRAGIGGVPVTLQRAASRDDEGHTGITDAAGNFRIEGIPDGEYIAGFGKPGFFPADLSQQGRGTLHISAGKGPVHLDLALTPLPKLRGKVVDEEGHAVPEATVELVHTGGGGRPKTASAKDGTFTFEDMLPGFFVLRAVPPAKLPKPKASEDEPAIWAPTYYPGVSERFRAERIRFGERDVEGYDIKLVAAPAFHVRGIVVDDEGKPVAGAILQLICPDSLDERSHAPSDEPEAKTTSANDGAFDFSRVRPGEWHLAARIKRGSQVLSAVVSGTVSKGDWDNVKVHVTAPFTVRGIVERTGVPGASSSHHTWVGLIPAWQTRLMGIHDESGAFEIDEVIPGKYQILLEQPLPGSYVDRV